jgi:hypothetical protein
MFQSNWPHDRHQQCACSCIPFNVQPAPHYNNASIKPQIMNINDHDSLLSFNINFFEVCNLTDPGSCMDVSQLICIIPIILLLVVPLCLQYILEILWTPLSDSTGPSAGPLPDYYHSELHCWISNSNDITRHALILFNSQAYLIHLAYVQCYVIKITACYSRELCRVHILYQTTKQTNIISVQYDDRILAVWLYNLIMKLHWLRIAWRSTVVGHQWDHSIQSINPTY